MITLLLKLKTPSEVASDIGIPEISGSSDALKVITVNSGGTAFELATPSGGGTIYGTCSTSGSTAAKTVSYSGFTLEAGATINVLFSNGNTAASPTLNVNSTGAASIALEDGTTASSTYRAYFPAGAVITFVYDGSYWRFKNNIVKNYVSGTSWYRIWADGFKEQGGLSATPSANPQSHSLITNYSNTDYIVLIVPCGTSADVYPTYVASKSTSSFSTTRNGATPNPINWLAAGY
jgi:hypothetical protein